VRAGTQSLDGEARIMTDTRSPNGEAKQMSVVGIIAEFNPFHNGHAEHLGGTLSHFSDCPIVGMSPRSLDGVSATERGALPHKKTIAVMSGNFVQRGEPAICDKFLRTKMALLAGVDIVIEIPVPYVVCGADYFARGSVALLAATGVVDALSFGSECGDIEAIKTAGRILAEEPPEYKQALRKGLDDGLSFAMARGLALRAVAPVGLDYYEDFFMQPNNTLAIEYCKALALLGSDMEVFTTHRKKGGASATKIRCSLFNGEPLNSEHVNREHGEPLSGEPSEYAKNFLPPEVMQILQSVKLTRLDDFTPIFRYLLYRGDFVLGEGLENRFKKYCGDFSSVSDFIAKVKTKRYTYTRLQRAVLGIILGISPPAEPQYLRVLGFRRQSADLLSQMVKKATLPVITSGAAMDKILNSGKGAMLAKELEAGDIYRCAAGVGGGYRSERAAELVII